MEITKNELLPEQRIFFNNLSRHLNKKIFFYGSVQRIDYFPGYSDIDVDIFSDNVYSTITKIQHYLYIKRSKINKIIWRLNNGRIVYGYKLRYENKNMIVEISIYDNKFKKDIIEEHQYKSVLPYYVTFLLLILKIIYYKLNLINRKTYSYLKNKVLILSVGIYKDITNFLVIKDKDSNEYINKKIIETMV